MTVKPLSKSKKLSTVNYDYIPAPHPPYLFQMALQGTSHDLMAWVVTLLSICLVLSPSPLSEMTEHRLQQPWSLTLPRHWLHYFQTAGLQRMKSN